MAKALRWLQKHPTVFESLQAACVMTAGDLIAQKLVEKKDGVDLKRTAVFASFGLFIAGPIASTWYHFLDSKISFCWPRIQRGLMKMVADQILMAPAILAVCLSYLELANGSGTLSGVKEELKNKYTPILINSFKVWPAVQVLNFSLTPVQYQVLVVQLVGVAWNSYLSYEKNREIGNDPQDKSEKPKEE
ncbi:Uncharacterized protein GBIM_00409 [Gryllus bimaculatus]|nr:Uncharacterized protein GBIM_00409 [Gryllus bimaculatus]